MFLIFRVFSRCRTAGLLLLLACAPASAGPVTLGETGGDLLLGNGLVQYRFRPADRYDLCGIRLGDTGENLLLTGAHLVYCEDGDWKKECGAPAGGEGDAGFGAAAREVSGDARRRTLRVTASSDRLRLVKTFSLGEKDTALEITVRIEATGKHAISWGYPVLLWLDGRQKTWLRPVNTVRAGRVVEEMVEGLLRGFKVGNQQISLEPETWVACCDAAGKGGLLAVNGPGTLLRFRAGEQGQQGFLGLTFRNFAPGSAGKPPFVEAGFTLVPFAGEAKPAIAAALKRLGREAAGPRFPTKANSGRLLTAGKDVALWWDLPTSKVFRDEPVPAAKSAAVTLQAARGEREPFQIVLRPSAPLDGVRLECAGLRSARGRIGPECVSWHPLDYYRTEQMVDATGFVGEVPDTLLPTQPIACPAGRAQPFWITLRVPAETPAGEYRGEVRVLSGESTLAAVPVTVKVWDFTLPEERSLTAFCPLWRGHLEKHYGREKATRLWPAYLDYLAEHRLGDLHPEGSAAVKWAEDGSVASIDFTAFDKAMETFFGRYRMKQVVLGDFTIGWGHLPRDNRFGKVDEILSPRWRARCEAYARALAAHLREKGWENRVVFSLFDEPDPKYYPLIRDTVALLKGVEPAWRFTFWGVYAPGLEGAIQVWTVPADYYSPSLAARVRARGEEVWVYNPSGYCVDATAMAVRANYWWAWRERIPVVYQWTTNAWIEWTGSTTLWDAHRGASWILPGEEGPTGTLRLELTREAMEDHEYLTLLERLCADGERNGLRAPAAAGRKALAEARRIAWAPENEQAAILHTQDQVRLHALRVRLGDCIEALSRGLR